MLFEILGRSSNGIAAFGGGTGRSGAGAPRESGRRVRRAGSDENRVDGMGWMGPHRIATPSFSLALRTLR